MAHSLSDWDTTRQAVVIATMVQAEQEKIIGVARLSRSNPDDTEAGAALVIRDYFQNQGVRQTADANVGVVIAENIYTMKMLRRLGYTVETRTEYGECRVRFRI